MIELSVSVSGSHLDLAVDHMMHLTLYTSVIVRFRDQPRLITSVWSYTWKGVTVLIQHPFLKCRYLIMLYTGNVGCFPAPMVQLACAYNHITLCKVDAMFCPYVGLVGSENTEYVKAYW